MLTLICQFPRFVHSLGCKHHTVNKVKSTQPKFSSLRTIAIQHLRHWEETFRITLSSTFLLDYFIGLCTKSSKIVINQTNSMVILILDREMLFCDRDRFQSTNLTLRAGAWGLDRRSCLVVARPAGCIEVYGEDFFLSRNPCTIRVSLCSFLQTLHDSFYLDWLWKENNEL